MKYFRITIAFTCIVALNKCAKESAAVSSSIVVPLEACANLSPVKPAWTVCFDEVTDSRCPINANCIWQGYASVKLSLQTSTDTSHFILNTLVTDSSRFRNDTTIGGVNFRLVKLSPYPGEVTAPETSNYVVELAITGQ